MKKINHLSAMLLVCLLAVAFKNAESTVAAADYFLKIEGVKGTSKNAEFAGWIQATKVKVSDKAIRFFREPDKCSNKIAGFYNAPAQATPAVFVARPKGNPDLQSLKITLHNWKMSDYFAQGFEEEIELKFGKLEAVATVGGVEKEIPAAELKAFFEKNFK